jgi:hypothetical protein
MGGLRSAMLVLGVRDAIRGSSRTPARALWLPEWARRDPDGGPPSRRQRCPVVTVTVHVPWRAPVAPRVPDVDHVAAALPGLVAAAMRLSGKQSCLANRPP